MNAARELTAPLGNQKNAGSFQQKVMACQPSQYAAKLLIFQQPDSSSKAPFCVWKFRLTDEGQSRLIIVEMPSPWPTGSCENHFPELHLGLGFRIFETTIALWLGRPGAQMETFRAMSRRAQFFTQNDVTKAVKGVVKAGVKSGRLEIVPGKISLFFGEPEVAVDLASETSADLRKLL